MPHMACLQGRNILYKPRPEPATEPNLQRVHILCLTEPCLQGLGILWPTNIGVVELNWCKVLAAQPGDRQRTGLHFGLAVRSQFL